MAKSKVLIENDKTIVTEWSFDVGDSTGIHTHEYNYIVVPMLDGELKETNSIWVGSDPSSTTDDAQKNIAVGTTALDAVTTGDDVVAIGYDALTDNTEGYSK